ncbi:MAG: phosphodiester glycosidase family protein [Bacteroidales bacterium]|nr:phosphodiester glycosidase family protein [Bacteroidales bacterium]MBQ9255395.1 phosphodiester glycosidase family protein [Bacteroidales bacterium]
MKILRFSILFLLIFCNIIANSQTYTSYVEVDTVFQTQDTLDWSLVFYTPQKSFAKLSLTRPDTTKDKNIVMSVPAAFTAQDLKHIVGDVVSNGVLYRNKADKENGYCLLYRDTIIIDYLNTTSLSAKTKAIKNKGAYFQQMLLLKGGDTVECLIFRKQKPTFRRCIAVRNEQIVIVESVSRLTFEDFANALKLSGIKDAIYLDMGTWSEGFIRNKDGEYSIIGNLRANTKHQTNWLNFVAPKRKQTQSSKTK